MKRIPRIAKIYNVEFPRISCVFTNGEYRIVDVKSLFLELGIKPGQYGFELLSDMDLFNSVEVIDQTLSWKNLTLDIKLPSGGTKSLHFDLDPHNVYKYSKPDPSKKDDYTIGRAIKNLRQRMKLSQEDVAQQIGSNKQYLSRIENDKSDLELNTLKRIYELGFNRKLFISHFDENDFLNSYSNSIFTNQFIHWADKNHERLDLIEGIGEKIKLELEGKKINTTSALASLSFDALMAILESLGKPHSIYHFPESWTLQAKCLQQKDWFNLIKLQRMLKADPEKKEFSKLEIIAKKETKHHLFEIE